MDFITRFNKKISTVEKSCQTKQQQEKFAGFFNDFPIFYNSKVGSHPNRLNKRYQAIIENNKQILKDSTILDIASHDGRWSFACIKNGAKHVLGIEGREHLVKKSNEFMKEYGIQESKYTFKTGDINVEIPKLEENRFDVVLCLGYFYHTLEHYRLLSEISRLNPKYLILDSRISTSENTIIQIRNDPVKTDSASIIQSKLDEKKGLVGYPSKKALEMLLENFGFEYQYFDWNTLNINNWIKIEDYKNGERITLLAKNMLYNS